LVEVTPFAEDFVTKLINSRLQADDCCTRGCVRVWLYFDKQSFNWQAVASIATLLMTLFIQRSEHRDAQAIHAKLDELLRAHGKAQDSLATLDDREPEQIEAFRKNSRPKR
jgi:low affinity Fe/Cu permease